MSEESFKKIFSMNLNHYMELHGKTQSDLINDLGFNKSAVMVHVYLEWIKWKFWPNTLILIVQI